MALYDSNSGYELYNIMLAYAHDWADMDLRVREKIIPRKIQVDTGTIDKLEKMLASRNKHLHSIFPCSFVLMKMANTSISVSAFENVGQVFCMWPTGERPVYFSYCSGARVNKNFEDIPCQGIPPWRCY